MFENIDIYKRFKQFSYRLLIPLIRVSKYIHWQLYLLTAKDIRLVVGAGPTKFPGWFSTDIYTLDVTKESDFKEYFTEKKIKYILAEHMLEHLTNEQLNKMVSNFYKYTDETINIRVAVPDGFHSDQQYINLVKPGGFGMGAEDHKNLFNYKTLSNLFEKQGFKSRLIEYWDENSEFHIGYKNDNKGFVERSMLNDDRNKMGNPVYTSIIIDFTK